MSVICFWEFASWSELPSIYTVLSDYALTSPPPTFFSLTVFLFQFFFIAEVTMHWLLRDLASERDMPAGVKEIAEAFSSSFCEVDRRFLDIARTEQLKVN